MQQYVDMKAENPDALLMFRLGDFYESFFEDAKTIASALKDTETIARLDSLLNELSGK